MGSDGFSVVAAVDMVRPVLRRVGFKPKELLLVLCQRQEGALRVLPGP